MGLISDDTLQMLHAVRLLGNEAVHCAKEYSRNELCVVMDIIESVLYSYYVVLSKGQQMLNMPIAKYGSFVIAINKWIKDGIDSGSLEVGQLYSKQDIENGISRKIVNSLSYDLFVALDDNIKNNEYTHLKIQNDKYKIVDVPKEEEVVEMTVSEKWLKSSLMSITKV